MPVVDASVVVDWVAPHADPHGPAGLALEELAAAGDDILAPRLMPEEVANALVTGIRRSLWSGAEADVAFDLLRRLPVQLVDLRDDLHHAWQLSRRYDQHPIYDMLYVAVALRVEQPLFTADKALARRLRGQGIVRTIG